MVSVDCDRARVTASSSSGWPAQQLEYVTRGLAEFVENQHLILRWTHLAATRDAIAAAEQGGVGDLGVRTWKGRSRSRPELVWFS
jgi:hypothetical protein